MFFFLIENKRKCSLFKHHVNFRQFRQTHKNDKTHIFIDALTREALPIQIR